MMRVCFAVIALSMLSACAGAWKGAATEDCERILEPQDRLDCLDRVDRQARENDRD